MSNRTRAVGVVAGVALAVLVGCGGTPPEAVATTEHLRQLNVLCGTYRGTNKGKMPPSVDELKRFARSSSKAADPEAMFISPRDKEPYEINLAVKADGVPMPGGAAKSVLAYEKTGAGGKRFVLFTSGEILELTETEFNDQKGK